MKMGRGKHQITKDKKDIQTLMKKAAAIRRARKAIDRKEMMKDLPLFIRDKLGNMFSNVDPLEAIAALSIMPIVKVSIDNSPKILEMYIILQSLGSPILGWLFSQIVKPDEIPKLDETMSWLISFGLAFIIVRNFGEILKTGQTIGGWVASLFAV